MNILLILIALILIPLLVLGILRTIQTQNSSSQKLFLAGKIPSPKPDGSYKGSAGGRSDIAGWRGKKFDATNSAGINLVGNSEKFPFKTYTGTGLADKDLQVFKIDYDIPKNPFWLRLILDEIVETSPNHYLGKIHLKIIPGFPFSLGYFKLEK